MSRLASLLFLVLLGLAIGQLTGVDVAALDHSSGYLYGTAVLLGIGLYASTFAIQRRRAYEDRRVITLAVTVGVIVKAGLIGGILALAFRDPLFLILGPVVAQIDPLSVAAILGNRRMSPRARTVLAAWASFDDPLTVLLAVYAATIATDTFGLGELSRHGFHLATGVAQYAGDLGLNLLLAAVAWVLWRVTRRWPAASYLLLLLVFAVAVWQFLMLGLAIVGLFLRPARLSSALPRLTQAALAAAAILLGTLLVGGVDPVAGVALGVAAFAAQGVVSVPLTRGMPRLDRIHLALAHQNGITAVILALRLESQFNGVVAIVAPGILVANLAYLLVNRRFDRREAHRDGAPDAASAPSPDAAFALAPDAAPAPPPLAAPAPSPPAASVPSPPSPQRRRSGDVGDPSTPQP
jgi:NhaP-type Na+/H+ or K+/H+ antiporter